MINYFDYSIEENEHLYGPGKRFVFWTQGCTIRCKGCTNQHLWTLEGAKQISKESFFNLVIEHTEIDGITLLGGEPTDQIEAFLQPLKKLRKRGISVILFTGREIEFFQTKKQKEFISCCDLVICGPYVAAQRDIYLHFRGSRNQRIIKISKRFQDLKIQDGYNVVSLKIGVNGSMMNKGFPDQVMNDLLREYGKWKGDELDCS